ncbi:MAG TPA: two-component regulator propeller domain-containing protein, partial [Bacteroidales bacterium]|nr:two-component regulator propeller domain-containing protein [Bacteroidales bacterium]
IIHYSSHDSTLALGRIRSIINDDKGTLWVGTTNGLFSLFPEKDSIVYHQYPDGKKIEILTMLPDKNRIWLGTANHGLLIFYLDDFRFSSFNIMKGMQKSQNMIQCLYKDENEILWAGTNSNGILQFNISDSTYSQILPDRQLEISYRVRKIIRDDAGNIWFGTRAGLFVRFPGKTDLYHYAHTDHKYSKISDNSIYDIYIDNTKVMWFGTYAGGVNYANLIGKPIYNFTRDEVIGESLSDNLLFGFCEDEKGNMYIGTNEGGLNYFEKRTGKFKWYMKDSENPCSINSNNVKSIVRESSGNLWIATYRGGVNHFDTKSECFTDLSRISKSSAALQSDNIYSLVLDNKENLWIASDNGIDLYKKPEGIIENIYTIDKVLCLYKDHYDRIWAGVEDVGLFQYDEGNHTFVQQFVQYINFCVRTIHLDANDNIWVGGNNGLSFFGTKDSTFINYTQADGLPTNLIMGILEDDHKNLWVSTTAGLLKCTGIVDHPDNLLPRIYTVQDGLQNNHFLNYSYYKSSTGELFFGGTKGFSMFHPDSIRDNPYVPQTAFAGLKIFNSTVKVGQKVKGKIVLEKTINQCRQITLSHKHRIFTIEFTALHYANPKDNRYKYMMYPFEKEWNHSDASRPFVTYSNLPGGTYTFRLISANSDELWNEVPKELIIRILPPLWKTAWFDILLLILVTSSVIFYYYNRIRVIQKQKDTLELMVKERTKTITEMNKILKIQTIKLKKTNSLLKEQKSQITKQAKELRRKKEELLAQKETLQNLNSMKDRFFSIIAHDLKGPFQGILGMTELLDKNYNQFSNQERKKYFNAIFNSSKNFYDLLDNLLCWARTQLSHIPFSQTEFDLKEIIHKNKLLYEENLIRKNITISEQYESDTMVNADLNMIDIVFRNLLSNAIKFTHNKGNIGIRVSKMPGMKLISIKDTGIGMNQNIQNNLFKIDKSVSRQGTADEMGTGLGLIICKEFIEKNGGKIWAESEAGKGSTFFFTLPKNHLHINQS